jgi:hypothetical protein
MRSEGPTQGTQSDVNGWVFSAKEGWGGFWCWFCHLPYTSNSPGGTVFSPVWVFENVCKHFGLSQVGTGKCCGTLMGAEEGC